MRKLRRENWLIAVWVMLLLAGTAVTTLAQSDGGETAVVPEISDDEVNKVAKDLYCPVCENIPLDVCGTQACADWRELIRTKLAEGQDEQQIFDYFARQYGSGVLAKPPREGLSLILWLFPIVAVALGLIFFGRYMQGLRVENSGPPADTAVAKQAAPDDYAARVEQELRQS